MMKKLILVLLLALPISVDAQFPQSVATPVMGSVVQTTATPNPCVDCTFSGTVTFGSTVVTNAATGVAAGYKVARGSTAFDGSNPTTVATGLTTVVSCVATLIRSTSLGLGTALVTHAAASGANVDFYAWIIAGTASAGTEVFEWSCVGT